MVRSGDYFAGGAAGAGGRAAVFAGDEDHAERNVVDGRGDDGGHRCFEQHFDCGIRQTFASPRKAVEGSSVGGIAVAAEAGTDDFAGHAVGFDSDGVGN